MKLAVLATVAALGAAALAMPSQAATLGGTKVGVTSHGITQAACVWRRHRVHVPRHVRPNGTVVPGHWVVRRVKVCN
jgi:hypothetical protein